jgi:hypothetical protein
MEKEKARKAKERRKENLGKSSAVNSVCFLKRGIGICFLFWGKDIQILEIRSVKASVSGY